MKVMTTKKIPMWLKIFIAGVATCSLQFLPSAHAIAAQGPLSPADSISLKYPEANPVLERKGYTIAYDGRAKTALWVYEELTQDSVNGDAKRLNYYLVDPDIPNIIQPKEKDYEDSGFHLGHLSPAADHYSSEEAMRESFYISNMSPQVPQFNKGYWKSFEKHVRDLTNEYDVVRVVTGPLYLPHEESCVSSS